MFSGNIQCRNFVLSDVLMREVDVEKRRRKYQKSNAQTCTYHDTPPIHLIFIVMLYKLVVF